MTRSIAIGSIFAIAIGAAIAVTLSSHDAAASERRQKVPRVVSIPVDAISFSGSWVSHLEYRIDGTHHDGSKTTWDRTKTSDNVVTVGHDFINALLDSGSDSDHAIPSDCRVALRWNVKDESIWWTMDLAPLKKPIDGGDCDYNSSSQGDFPDDQVYPGWTRTTAAVLSGGFHDGMTQSDFKFSHAGPGTVTIKLDGTVTLDASDAGTPSAYSVLASVDEQGNVVFWMIEKP
jgi:hypothetical protein